jgi:hypothetical protein
MNEELYCIQEQSSTTGDWYLIDVDANNLTKSECKEMYQSIINKGSNPNYLRIVRVQ